MIDLCKLFHQQLIDILKEGLAKEEENMQLRGGRDNAISGAFGADPPCSGTLYSHLIQDTTCHPTPVKDIRKGARAAALGGNVRGAHS